MLACLYLEEYGVLSKELGQVGVSECPDEHHVLILVGVLSLECAGHDQHRLDGPHAKVVVVLLRELLTAQLVHLGHLLGQALRGLKPLRVQDHLSY